MRRSLHALTILIFALSAPASAQNSVEDLADIVRVQLLAGWRQADGSHVGAVRISLAPGWKTYWRVPGDGGIPPRFDWSNSSNLGRVQILWPRPTVFVDYGMRTIGYMNQLVLPIEFHPVDNGSGMKIDGSLEFGVCEDVCIPVTAELSAILPADANTSVPEIAKALKNRPATQRDAGVGSVTCALSPIKNGFRLTARIDLPRAAGSAPFTVFEIANPDVWVSESKSARQGDRLVASTEVVNYGDGVLMIDRSTVRMTVFGTAGPIDIRGCSTP